MKQGIIYLIINKVNGHKYVGQTTQGMNKRWAQHIQEANRMSPYPLHKAMRKHGNHNFMIREICECKENELNDKEQYYIKEYNTFNSSEGYNATSGSNNISPVRGANSLKDKLDNNDKLHPPVRDAVRGGFHLAENRGDGKHMSNKVLSVNVETGEEIEWESISEAARQLTGDRKKCSNIILALNKGYKAYGHLWKRLEPSKHSIKVYGVHKQTWLETPVYNSIKEAGRIYGSETAIARSIKNPRRNSYKGYYWYRA